MDLKYIGATMKISMKNFCWMVVFLTIFSCAKKEETPSRSVPEAASFESEKRAGKQELQVIDRKIIKEGEIHFETSDLAKTRKLIDEAIKELKGYISKEDEYTYNDRIAQSLIIRVPAENFDKLVADISKGVKRFDRKRIQARDVTEEYLDIELRIKIKKETESRYRELLSKAKTVEEILSIEKQIGELRAEIESIEGRLKYLQNRLSYSTLTVAFYERVSTPVSFSSKLGVGLKNGWNNFVWFLIGLVNIWPFILLGSFGIVGIIAFRRKRKTKKAALANSTGNGS